MENCLFKKDCQSPRCAGGEKICVTEVQRYITRTEFIKAAVAGNPEATHRALANSMSVPEAEKSAELVGVTTEAFIEYVSRLA